MRRIFFSFCWHDVWVMSDVSNGPFPLIFGGKNRWEGIRPYKLYYARGSVIVMILHEADTYYALLQGHTILEDVIPL